MFFSRWISVLGLTLLVLLTPGTLAQTADNAHFDYMDVFELE